MFSPNHHQILESATTWSFEFYLVRGISVRPFEWEGQKTFINVPTALCLHFLSNGSLSKERMVLKSSTERCEVSVTLFCVLSALNFTFRNLIPVGFKFRSRKAGRLKKTSETLSFPMAVYVVSLCFSLNSN